MTMPGSPDRPLWLRDAWELADAVRSGELRVAEVLEVHLERIGRIDPELNAVCFLDVAAARQRARRRSTPRSPAAPTRDRSRACRWA